MLVEQAKTPFFAFCCKMQSEYADLKSYLKEDQSPFSDMYECRYWGLSNKTATFTLTIEGQPSANEITDFVSPQGKIGRVDNIEKKEEENQTIVTITLKLAKEATRFALALRREPEKFQITKEAVTIQPKNEPDAAIDIPEGTFDKAAELQLNVVETKDVNEDEESGPILMTNVIDMSMSDGQQPNKGIDMKLPIHSKDQNDVLDLCVLATSEEEPDDIDDWEIIEAKPDKSGKAAVFKIEHFSIYAGASKKKVEKEKEEVIKAVIRSMKRTRKVEFTVYIQTDSTKRGVFQLIVEVTSPKKTDKRKSHWLKQGYTIQGQKEEKEYEVEEKQRFVELDYQLIESLKEKNVKKATKLLVSGADLNVADTNGCLAMHYAAAEGYTDLVAVMMEYDGKVNILDEIGQTPLHKAAIGGHSRTIQVLLGFGAYIHARDKGNCTPLDTAVINNQLRAVDTLLVFGADAGATRINWSFTESEEHRMTPKQKKIFKLLHSYRPLSIALNSGGLVCETQFVLAEVQQPFHRVKATAWLQEHSTPWLMLLKRTQSEYVDMSDIIGLNQRRFSDKYDCRVFKLGDDKARSANVNFLITIDGLPARNETVVLVTLKSKARIWNVDVYRDLNQTVVRMSMICHMDDNVFALVTEEKEPEKVLITDKETTITPMFEPDAVIRIPQNTFEGQTELLINVLDGEIESSTSSESMPSTLLSLNTSNGLQPKQDVDISIPIDKLDARKGMCVLATSKEYPEDVSDWEILQADVTEDQKCISFKAKHFSIYAGARKEDVENNLPEVVENMQMTITKQKSIVFSVYIRHSMNKPRSFDLVLEVTPQRKQKHREKFWTDDGFTKQKCIDEVFKVDILQRFQLKFDGNFKTMHSNDFTVLEFDGKKKIKSLVLEMQITDSSQTAEGSIVVYKERDELEEVEKVVQKSSFLCSKSEIIKEKIPRKSLDYLVAIPVKYVIPVEDDIDDLLDDDKGDGSDDKTAFNTTLNTMVSDYDKKFPKERGSPTRPCCSTNSKTQKHPMRKDNDEHTKRRKGGIQHINIKHTKKKHRDQWTTGADFGRPFARQVANGVVILDYVCTTISLFRLPRGKRKEGISNNTRLQHPQQNPKTPMQKTQNRYPQKETQNGQGTPTYNIET
ncbi:hypothetical protein FSP39_011015 [Pinctada imbricata]|uniref:Uncharacterized protein n=1 Tax=Pinctada imbricata TaxID=66713 RepID=A0AA88YMV8_PINIB|nr:hypothetical protein FSP39_011015 [Pinctada imbricata]